MGCETYPMDWDWSNSQHVSFKKHFYLGTVWKYLKFFLFVVQENRSRLPPLSSLLYSSPLLFTLLLPSPLYFTPPLSSLLYSSPLLFTLLPPSIHIIHTFHR